MTTATVSAPTSRAISAMTGAAPVPVPPPMPAVTKTMSEPIRRSRSRSRSSIAAARPRSGFAPQPRPRVTCMPSCTLIGASLCWSACASVFATMNSTPARPERIIVLSALPPPPPTPITLIFAFNSPASSNSSRSSLTSSSGPTSSRSNPLPILPSGLLASGLCGRPSPRRSRSFDISPPNRAWTREPHGILPRFSKKSAGLHLKFASPWRSPEGGSPAAYSNSP